MERQGYKALSVALARQVGIDLVMEVVTSAPFVSDNEGRVDEN